MSSSTDYRQNYSLRSEIVSDETKINGRSINDLSLGLMFFESMKKHSNRVLQYIVDTGEEDTYGDVLKRSIRTALKLKEKGIKKDDIISICSYNHKNNLVALVATLFVGAINVNFHPNLLHQETIHLLKLTLPKIMFIDQESLPYMEKCLELSKVNTELVVFGNTETYSQFSEYLQPSSSENDFKPARVDSCKDTAIILFSSGTTEFPKGVCLSHYSLLQINSEDFGSDNVFLVYSSYNWITSHMCIIKCLTSGSARVVCPKFDAHDSWRIIEKYKVKTTIMAPFHAAEIVNYQQDVDTSSLKYFYIGGSPVTKKLMDDLKEALPNAYILQMYGQTESAGIVAKFDRKDRKEVEMQIKKPKSCGKMIKNVAWKIIDPVSEEMLGPNQIGELRLKSDFFMNSYYLRDSTFAYDSQGYFKTGDLLYYDDDEHFFVVGRTKEIIWCRDWHILPSDLEEILITHPAVKEAVVVGIPHIIDGEQAVGIVVLHEGYEDVTPDDLEQYVQERVRDGQRLRGGVKIVKETVRTTTEKVKRHAMKKMLMDGLI